MLIEFQVANYRSFFEEDGISLVAAPLAGRTEGVRETRFSLAPKLLPVAAIFGANASGKSNLLRAISFLQGAIEKSFTDATSEGRVPRTHFGLTKKGQEDPTLLEISFIADDNLFQYGFSCNDDEFLTEWLYAYPKNKKQVWFERNGQVFSFGPHLKGRNQVISDITRPDTLFLSAAMKTNHSQLKVVSDYIASIDVNLKYAISGFEVSRALKNAELDPRVLLLLKMMDTGIIDYQRVDVDVPEEIREQIAKVSKVLNEVLGKGASAEVEGPPSTDIKFRHSGSDDGYGLLGADEESAGTRRLMILLGSALKALDSGTLLVVDELDASLHTRACQQVVQLFLDKSLNAKGAQLLFTTHDTNLLADQFLRRDEIWFVEKNNLGMSRVYPASEFRIRQTDNIEKAYLDDRLGAMPGRINPAWLIPND